MKTLYLIRHAKSDAFYPCQMDFRRGLSHKWEEDIKKIWKQLYDKNIHPDLVVSSTAQRAKLTVEWICKFIWYKKKYIEYRQEIYDSHMNGYDVALATIMEVTKTDFWEKWLVRRLITKIAHDYLICGKKEVSRFYNSRKKIKKWYKWEIDTVFFIGHNLAISELADYLTGWDIWKMPTCSVLAIEFDIENWEDIAQERGKQVFFLKPKDI